MVWSRFVSWNLMHDFYLWLALRLPCLPGVYPVASPIAADCMAIGLSDGSHQPASGSLHLQGKASHHSQDLYIEIRLNIQREHFQHSNPALSPFFFMFSSPLSPSSSLPSRAAALSVLRPAFSGYLLGHLTVLSEGQNVTHSTESENEEGSCT